MYVYAYVKTNFVRSEIGNNPLRKFVWLSLMDIWITINGSQTKDEKAIEK